MAFCKNCGAELGEEHKFCGNCGAPVEKAEETEKNQDFVNENEENTENNNSTETEEQGSYEDTCRTEPCAEEVTNIPEQKGKLSVGMLVWAIINTVFSFCSCCLPVGILPLIFAIMTNTPDIEKSQKNRRLALIFNAIVTALVVISIIVSIIGMILYWDIFVEALEESATYN